MCFERGQINGDRCGTEAPKRMKSAGQRQVNKGGHPKAAFGIEVSGE